MRITYANARFPGSAHDSGIWMVSGLRIIFREKFRSVEHQSEFLLGMFQLISNFSQLIHFFAGDNGFPLEPWLLTPYPTPDSGTPEEAYNRQFIKARNIVERCFGVFKSRFRF